jgi:hypothetical protein
MQPTIHLERKAGYGHGKYPALPSLSQHFRIIICIRNSGKLSSNPIEVSYIETFLSASWHFGVYLTITAS